MIFLIDFENVKVRGMQGYQYLQPEDHVILFFSDNAKNLPNQVLFTIKNSGCKFDIIKLKRIGKNGLDFYIASELGRIVTTNCKENIVIISNDKGFNAVKDFWNTRNIIIYTQPDIEHAIKCVEKSGKRRDDCIFGTKMYSIESFHKTYYTTDPLMNTITNMFQNTEHQSHVKDIYNIVRANKQTPKTMYTETLHAFGRQTGLELYRTLKNSKELQAVAYEEQ